MATNFFVSHNDYVERYQRLPVPGANSRQQQNPNLDALAVSTNWNNFLSVARQHNNNNQSVLPTQRQIVDLHVCLLSLHQPGSGASNRLLPRSPAGASSSASSSSPATFTVSLPPVASGGVIDIFWPTASSSSSSSSDSDNAILLSGLASMMTVGEAAEGDLPRVPPLQFPVPAEQPQVEEQSPCEDVFRSASSFSAHQRQQGEENEQREGASDKKKKMMMNLVATTQGKSQDELIQEQWLPVLCGWLQEKAKRLHRHTALRGIKNKRWQFEAESYLSSLPEEEWDVVVTRGGCGGGGVQSSSASSSFGANSSSAGLATSITQTIQNGIDSMFGNGSSSGGGANSNYNFHTTIYNTPLSNANNNNYGGGSGSNSSTMSSAATTAPATKALHLSFKLFGSRSACTATLLEHAERVVRHAEQQMTGVDVRNHTTEMVGKMISSPSASSASTAPANTTSVVFASSSSSSSSSPAISNIAVEATLSFTLNISERSHDEYTFESVLDQKLRVKLVLVDRNKSSNKNSATSASSLFVANEGEEQGAEGRKKVEEEKEEEEKEEDEKMLAVQRGALEQLNFSIARELAMFGAASYTTTTTTTTTAAAAATATGAGGSRQSSINNNKCPVPAARAADFSLMDYIPVVEEAVVAIVERNSSWCKLLYGFAVTFGQPLWNRVLVTEQKQNQQHKKKNGMTQRVIKTTQPPPALAGHALFLFETPQIPPPSSSSSSSSLRSSDAATATAGTIEVVSSSSASAPTPLPQSVSFFISVTKEEYADMDDAALSTLLAAQQQHQESSSSSSSSLRGNSSSSSSGKHAVGFIPPSVSLVSAQLERGGGSPLMFSWLPSSQQQQRPAAPEQYAGTVLTFLVEALPKLQSLLKSVAASSSPAPSGQGQ